MLVFQIVFQRFSRFSRNLCILYHTELISEELTPTVCKPRCGVGPRAKHLRTHAPNLVSTQPCPQDARQHSRNKTRVCPMHHATCLCVCANSGCMRACTMKFCTMWSRSARAWRIAHSCVSRFRCSCSQRSEHEGLEGALEPAIAIDCEPSCQLCYVLM